MYLITGASDNHFKSLQNMLTSFYRYKQNNDKIIVYNLDLSSDNWILLQKLFPQCIFKVFDYCKYPSYYNINVNAGEYAWKPALIKESIQIIFDEDPIICWMDSGNLIIESLQKLELLIKNCSIYTPIASGSIKSWTHVRTLEFMKAPNEILNFINRNGACVAFDVSKDWVRNFINEWANLASIKECIAPDGSNRENHRQDQSVLSILYYIYHQKYEFNIHDKYLAFTIHKDADIPETAKLVIVCLEDNYLHPDKILQILKMCNTKCYDLFYYNCVLNNKNYIQHFSTLFEDIVKNYEKIVLISNKDNLIRDFHPINFFYESDSYGGDIDKVIPWSISSILSDLCKNNDADAINTLGYLKKIKNTVQSNNYLKNGGIYVKTSNISKVFISVTLIHWLPYYSHFNLLL